MSSRWLVLVFLASSAAASSRFEVIGLSKTHLALREFYSLSECCGADPVVDCRYDGLAALQKQRLDVLTSPIRGVTAPQRPWFTGVRLHFVPWEPNSLVEPEAKGSKHFEIYRSVTTRAECTSTATAAATLAEAHAFASSVGIDLKAPLTSKSLEEPPLSVDACTVARYDPVCAGDGEQFDYFVLGNRDATAVLRLFVKVRERTWLETEFGSNGGAWLAPRRQASAKAGQVMHYRRIGHFMGELFEAPLFLVRPAR